MNKEFEVTFRAIYIPSEDISVIFKEIYKALDKPEVLGEYISTREIQTREIVGFYHGEPDEYSTCQFLNGGLKADYTYNEKGRKVIDRNFIDVWVESHVTFNSIFEKQVKDLCKFPGLENKESLAKEILERYLDEGRDMAYTDTIVDILNRKEK